MPCDYCSSVCNGVLCINTVEELSFYGILVLGIYFSIYGFTLAGGLDCNIANATHILEYVLNTPTFCRMWSSTCNQGMYSLLLLILPFIGKTLLV